MTKTDTSFRVTLLGSGAPQPNPLRFGPATLIEAGAQKVLVDAGRGASMRLFQLGVPIGSIDLHLLTHFHSDHVVGLPDIWLTGWLAGKFGRRRSPMRIVGPKGTLRLTHHLFEAYRADIDIRIADEKLPAEGASIDAEEFVADGVIHDHDGLRITCFEVDHGDLIKPAFGYRFDYAGKSAVLSGDTRYCDNLIRHAMGVDLLIHEVAMTRPQLMQVDRIRRVIDHHSTPQDASSVFRQTKPRLAVFHHLVLIGDDSCTPPSIQELIDATRKEYNGTFVVGEDLMSFHVGQDWDPPAPPDPNR